MSVFRGSASLDAVEAICDDATTGDTVERLAGLVEANLIQPVPPVMDVPRFRLLETIREYAAERLADSGHQDETVAAHADWFAGWAGELTQHTEGPEASQWLARAVAEADNLRAAIEHLDTAGRHDDQLQLIADCMGLWFDCGLEWEGLTRLERALAVSGPLASARAIALAHWSLLYHESSGPDADGRAREAIALARASGDVPVESFALQILGVTVTGLELATRAFREAIQVSQRARGLPIRYAETSPDEVESSSYHGLANVWMYRSISTSIGFRQEAIAIRDRVGYRRGNALTLSRLAESYLLTGDLAAARGALDRAGSLIDEQAPGHYEQTVSSVRGLLAHYEDRFDDAELLLQAVVNRAMSARRFMYLARDAGPPGRPVPRPTPVRRGRACLDRHRAALPVRRPRALGFAARSTRTTAPAHRPRRPANRPARYRRGNPGPRPT